MNWITKLERKLGKYAISGIMKYIIIFQAIGLILLYIDPSIYVSYLSMDAQAILDGQVWRIVTFIMEPPSTSPIFVLFAFYLYYMIGASLENAWGTFRFNLYLLAGVLFHVLAALLAYGLTILIWGIGISYPLGTGYLYLSLFFAFAVLYPNVQFLLFYIIPVKVKYLAMFNGLFFGITIVQGIVPNADNIMVQIIQTSNAIAAFVSLLNFVLFYFSSRQFKQYSPKQVARRKQFKKEIHKAQRPENTYANGAKHKCTVCGRTELDDPTLEFRYCSKCNGNYEYCQEHLFTHEHIK